MPQKVKIQTGFSEKTTENYQSQQYSVALEMDCTVNGTTREIEEASNKLFALCRKIVSAQKGVNVDNLLKNDTAASATTPAQSAPTPAPAASQPSNGNGTGKPASPKQIRFLLELCKKSGMSKQDINAMPQKFKKQSFEQLSSVEASHLIENLNQKKAA